MKKKIAAIITAVALALGLSACQDDAQIANHNLTKAADNFEVERHIVGINGITDEYLFEVIGRCSIENNGRHLTATCKHGEGDIRRHYLGLSDNVTFTIMQLEPADVSVYRFRLTFKPEQLIPDVDLRTSLTDG